MSPTTNRASGGTSRLEEPGRLDPPPPGLLVVPPDQLAWYAVWTRSRAEKMVHQHLTMKGVETFLPLVQRWSRWKDRRKQIDWPLFPGYCFARFEARDSLNILTSAGVATIVAFNGRLAPIPDFEIDGIQRVLTSGLQFDPCPFIKEGDPVEVVSGPLRGVKGKLLKKGPRARLLLLVDIIAKGVSVQVDAADVRAL